MFSSLPLDLQTLILDFIQDPDDVLSFERVCKSWRNHFSDEEKIWKPLFLNNYKGIIQERNTYSRNNGWFYYSHLPNAKKELEEMFQTGKTSKRFQSWKDAYLHYFKKRWMKTHVGSWQLGSGTWDIRKMSPNTTNESPTSTNRLSRLLSGILTFNTMKGPIRIQCLIIGLDAAGKTTMIYKLNSMHRFKSEITTTIPTIGFNIEQTKYRNIDFTVWDVGGPDKIRPLWRHYYHGIGAFIFVVDSNDIDRIQDAAIELHQMLREVELKGVPLLVYANKQDLPRALKPYQVAEALELDMLADRDWYICGACATAGEGLVEGLDWLLNHSFKFLGQ